MDAQVWFVIIALLVVGLVVFFVTRSSGAEPPKAEPPPEADDAKAEAEAETKAKPKKKKKKKKKKPADDRLEVEAPVEIHDGMSLAELKRAKAARIKGDKGRRETATEATAKAKQDHRESDLDDISMGWEELEASFGEDDKPADDVESPEDEALEAKALEAPAEDEDDSADVEAEEDAASDDAVDDAAEVEDEDEGEDEVAAADDDDEYEDDDEEDEPAPASLKDGLKKTRKGFIQRLGNLFSGESLDENLLEEVEEVLYTADIGNKASQHIIAAVEKELGKDDKSDPQAVWTFIRTYVEDLLEKREEPLDIDAKSPFVILVIGVNGVGKTTTIGKLASKYKKQGKSVLIVAGDTFRAAAVEQIEVWGDRAGIEVHTGDENADPASVVFAGIERGAKEGVDVIICDTAGRLHTKAPLLLELEKIGRVTQKVIDDAPHETILVLDANTGQNAIQQARMFNETLEVTGIVLTKLDGTAKGGVILGICDELNAPIRYIGIGEGVEDLRPFNAAEFAEALFI